MDDFLHRCLIERVALDRAHSLVASAQKVFLLIPAAQNLLAFCNDR